MSVERSGGLPLHGPSPTTRLLEVRWVTRVGNRYHVGFLKRREVVGYRRGDGRTRIDVDAGSGDLVIEPGS